MASLGSLTGPAKLQAVSSLLDKLSADLDANDLTTREREDALEELKIYGRDTRNAGPIFTKKGVEILTRHAFNNPSSTTSRNALKVLCNAMLLAPGTRQMFVDLGCEAKAISQLRNDNRDDEFLVSRLIFLTTYNTTVDLHNLIDEHKLADAIVENISRHATRLNVDDAAKSKVDPMEDMALIETLKLLFNVTRFCEDRIALFSGALSPIVNLLQRLDIPSPSKPLDPPFSPLVNALMNFKLDNQNDQALLFPADEPSALVNRLVELLDLSIKSYPENELEQVVTPLVCVVSSVYDQAPGNIRELMKKKLLPTEQDRQGVLGKGDSLTARLLRNSNNITTPEFAKAISHLLFELSDKNGSTFVQNVGYGYAAGFLFRNNIAVPESVKEGHNVGGGQGSAGRAVNPITGQFLDAENMPELPEMTDEEKEREAERLLKKLGVMSVQNPVEQAAREGRLEELPDDYEEEDGKKK
ncbi:hypothetical protein OQA88_4025 [Cercophora sp. LCS_1]